MKLCDMFKEMINENETKKVSLPYLEQLLNNTYSKNSRKLLKSFISQQKGGYVTMSKKQQIILNLIKDGKLVPKSFSSKN